MMTEIAGYIGSAKHLVDKSYYDNNFYEIIEPGGYFYCDDKCKIIYEEFSELYNCYTYHFGYFDNNDEFISMIIIENSKKWELV